MGERRESGEGKIVKENGTRKPRRDGPGRNALTDLSFAAICDMAIRDPRTKNTTSLLKLVIKNVRDGLLERDENGLMTPGAVMLTRDCLNRKYGRPKETIEINKRSMHLVASIRADQAKQAAILSVRNTNEQASPPPVPSGSTDRRQRIGGRGDSRHLPAPDVQEPEQGAED